MTKPDVQAHSAGDDDDNPSTCGVQQGIVPDDVIAHSAGDEDEDAAPCGIQQGAA
ncbi:MULTISPECIES: hypothetical protein [Streptomycetaceae]|uniref:hypothetical protein n=1 Tax=Streptomycetaceae TaxID=2062 RepID=UPI000B27ADF5|nr:hypothetical protein [Streptomyces sp. NRRL WC-3742]